jgi:sterol desaturase/sphingolipid hydroxylase (fatty acid hydroxylase superfamily)
MKDAVKTGGIAIFFAALVWFETRRALRRSVESKLVRDTRNLAVAGAGALVLRSLEKPVADRLLGLVARRKWGLLPMLRLPRAIETALAVILLDYTLYIWHVLTHRVPCLWRFHIVHHADLDMDASTALRFHFGELALSVPWRAAQIAVIGVSPGAYAFWQTALFLSILFHHSNVRLPLCLERSLNWFVVTPRMHGIHHSVIQEETNSNWSSGLTIWDWVHGTLLLDIPQEAITIGVPAYRTPDAVTLAKIIAMPFGPQPPAPAYSSELEPK